MSLSGNWFSNAADALTKFHYKSLTTGDLKSPEAELAIWINTIPDENLLIIRDTGIGMSKQEIIDNLGTIAHFRCRCLFGTN